MRSSLALLLFATACAGGLDSADSGGAPGGGGGGVSFGGAQDIGAFRAALERGEIPKDAPDANGFFNEHFNEPPPVTCGGTLCLTPGLSVGRDWLTGAHQATLQIAMHTTVDPSSFVRLPMNLVVVVDRSGSMSQDGRLDKVKVGLHALVDNLRDEDRIALLSFDHIVTHNAPFTETLDRANLHATIDRLTPGGSTDIYAALDEGFGVLGEYPTNERQNRMIFLSDGVATAGNTSRPAMLELARGRIAHGIGLTTIGVGTSFDVELMRGLAEHGAGNYYFLEDAAAATEVFTEELDYFMSPLALELSLEATAGAGWEFGEATGTNVWSSARDHGRLEIPAVFLASRTSQEPGGGRRGGGSMIFIHLEPTADATSQVADLTLTYRLPGTTERITETVTLDYAGDPQETLDDPHLSGAEMAERYAMYNLFLGLRTATRSASRGGACAAAALEATRRNALAWNERHPDPDITADLVLVDQFLANLADLHGELPSTELASCDDAVDPYEPGYDEDPYYDGWEGHDHAHCSAGGSGAGWLVIVGAMAFAVRRRRRR